MLTERNEIFYKTKLLHYLEPLVNPDNVPVKESQIHNGDSFNYLYTATHDRLAITILRDNGLCIVERENRLRIRYRNIDFLMNALRKGHVRIKEVKGKKK